MGLRFQFSEDVDIKFSGKISDLAIMCGYVPTVKHYGHKMVDVDQITLNREQVQDIAEMMSSDLIDGDVPMCREELEYSKLLVLRQWLETATADSTMVFC